MNKEKRLQGKMNDFKRYGFTLLALTAFLYLGVVMPIAGKTQEKTYILIGGTVVLLILSALCFLYSNKCRNLLLDSEEGQEYLD
ncbi:YrhC family protein [Bacillus sp. FJAT-49736]|uniref:YrhC family protein n=1 Tax=Bacillus sp. FJAT-49736 TaxID=2833582 RepID=UPI0032D569E4